LACALLVLPPMAIRVIDTNGILPGVTARRVAVARVARVFDYLFGILYALLAIRLLLEAIYARQGTGFFELIARLTDPFYNPFKGIVRIDHVDGARVVWPLVVAIAAYMILHAAIRGLLRILAR
jgi:uncharacterized protein YggT (Ycf19 family)